MRQKSLQLLIALILFLCMGSPAFALIAGFNADIHMDIDGVIADDFHIEGRIKSGPWMGGWSRPPVLVLHIDGMFPNFVPNIVPDPSVFGENTYKFRADWSGHPYRYCEILHLGLFFDVECHNLVIDLVGWWTVGGNRIIDAKNGGAVLIPGFDVQDQSTPQLLQIRNDSAQIADDGGTLPGIHGQIVQMDVSVLAKEEIERFGGVEELARGLRLGGLEGQLEWIPVSPGDDFPADSFFDVTFGVDTGLPTIPPQGFLVTRVLTAFTNNNGDPEPDFRWTWHLHESHEVQANMDWGDAPEDMSGIIGKYPTLLVSNGARHVIQGPWLGDPLDGPDPEANGQPEPVAMGDDMFDGNDDEDGVQIPILIQGVADTIMVEVNGGGGVVQIWIDWDGSRTWEAVEQIHNGFLPNGIHPIAVMAPVGSMVGQTFARCRISRQGGLSPVGIASDGEVEDHEVFIEVIQEQLDWGDAPEDLSTFPGQYPTLRASNGANHPLGLMWLGDKTDNPDPDPDGQPTNAADGDDNDGNDDEDGVGIPVLIQGVASTIMVEVSGIGGVLDAWIDFNGDRIWQDPGERIAGGIFYAPGLHPIPVTAPAGSVAGQTFARFRICHNGGLGPEGPGPAGEVEDHEVIIEERPPTGSIHGRKFEDLNANGMHDPGEPYLNGWKIELYDAAGNLIATTVTGDMDLNNDGTIDPASESGLYWFTNLPLGGYTVREVLQPEWTPSTPPSVSVTVTNLGVVVVDFGNYVTGSIHGFKFEDVDRDGNYDSSVDVPMGGVEFTLTGTDGAGNTVSMTTTTDANGEFAFVNLVPGIYTVKEIVPAGWIATTPISFTLTILSRQEYVALPGQAKLDAADPRIEIVYGVELMFGNATEINLDFGDAPQDAGAIGYPTLLPNGARHVMQGPWFGIDDDFPDGEINGQPTIGADGDDLLDGNDDEDGVQIPVMQQGKPAQIIVTVNGGGGHVDAWIDWNGDTIWQDPAERIFGNYLPDGNHVITVIPPIGSVTGKRTYARFRINSQDGLFLSPEGLAEDGEVEDHVVMIRPGFVEHDSFEDVSAEVTIVWPDGTAETVSLGGSMEVYVYFEGQEGQAGDDDGDGRDEVQTEMISLNLTGNSPSMGSLNVLLNEQLPSPGEMEEIANNTPGILDIPPFTSQGSCDSFFDIYVEVELPGVGFLSNINPIRVAGIVNYKPAGECDVLVSTVAVDLYDANGNLTGISIREVRLIPIRCNTDWGDAPDDKKVHNYHTLAVNNGARHKIDPKVYLGADIDPEWNGQPTIGADGDDLLDGNDDEDGVKFLTNPLRPGRFARVEVTASIDGFLSAWVDFDADGTWMPAGDRIFDSMAIPAGTHVYSFWVPMTAKKNVKTYSRWRFSTDPVPSPEGPAKNGEVEDHIVKIRSNPNVKWIQRPDETPMGIDIRVDSSDGIERVLADDWQCTEYGPITDVHLWVSWLHDIKGEIESIHLSVHTDIPADPDDPVSYSRPGGLKWAGDFGPDSFKEKVYRKLEEGEFWWDPYEGKLIPNGDHEIWKIDIDIPASDAFQQEGTPEEPVVYWLDVSIKLKDDMDAAIGWKTRRYPERWNDDAVMGATDLGVVYWNDLHYPFDHPYYLEDPDNPPSLDMAFVLTSDDCDICLGSADLNGDGIVDITDLAIVADQYLTEGKCPF